MTEFNRNVNSDNARRVLDGCAEARIIELACAQCRKAIKDGPSSCWQRNQKLFLILLSAVRQSAEP